MPAACPEEFVGFAAELAEASGAVVRRYYRSGLTSEAKADLSPVTIADRETEAALRRLIESRYPAHGIIGEEYGAERREAELVWVLDPIDGTKSFLTGRPLFGTLIALCREGAPILGVIDHPVLRERWIGAAGHPTLHDGKPVRTRSCERLEDACLFSTSPHMYRDEAATAFDGLRTACKQVVYGSDCYHFGLLASGFGDLVSEASLQIYDFLAAVPVVEGAGGVITDWDDRPLTIASGDRVLAAGDRTMHEAALALLR